MDTRSGHLVEDINEVPEKDRKNYTPVPKELEDDARAVLKGKIQHHDGPNTARSVYLKDAEKALAGSGETLDANALRSLQFWANQQNHLKAVDVQRQKNRAKNKVARASRKANRGSNRGR